MPTLDDFLMPADMDLDDPQFGDFLKEEFIELMTPMVMEWNISLEVAVPIETGQIILDSARSNSVSGAAAEAEGYINDLATVKDFFLAEIEASKRVLELDGYDVKVDIRASDSPRTGPRSPEQHEPHRCHHDIQNTEDH